MLIRLVGYAAAALGLLFGLIAFLGWLWWKVPSGKPIAFVLGLIGAGIFLLGLKCIEKKNHRQ